MTAPPIEDKNLIVTAYIDDLTAVEARRHWVRAWEDLCALVAACDEGRLPSQEEILHARRAMEPIGDLLDLLDELAEAYKA